MKNVKQYYKELGRILYVIVVANGKIQDEEKNRLHQSVTKELAHDENTHDSSGMNQAFYVNFEFEDLVRNCPELSGTLIPFKQCIEKNFEPGDEALIHRSIRLMESVADVYTSNKAKAIIEQVRNITGISFA